MKYRVVISDEIYTTYVVEAENIEEAEDKALMGEYLSIEDVISDNNEVFFSKEIKDNEKILGNSQ